MEDDGLTGGMRGGEQFPDRFVRAAVDIFMGAFVSRHLFETGCGGFLFGAE